MTFQKRNPLELGPWTFRRSHIIIWDDYLSNSSTWFANTSSGGSITQTGAATTSKNVGCLSLFTGTTTTGRSGISSHVDGIQFGTNAWMFETRCNPLNLSDANQSYTLRFGFMDSTSADPTDGHFFRYTHSVNSGKWQCVTRVNNAETVTNTNSTVPTLTNAEPLNVYRIDVNSDGTEVVFSIDGTTVAAHNKISGFSGVNRLTGIAYSIIKSAGTTARQFVIDYTYCVCTLGSQR